MKIITGLGNPGTEYVKTRHNIGFLFLDYLKDLWGFEDFKDSRFRGAISEGNLDGEKIILLKPLTFMNLSGESISSIANFYKLDHHRDIIVVVDDISMDFGKIRFRDRGSAGGHNGLKSMISCFGDEAFQRIKIGVGQDKKYNTSDWVLSKFSKEELNDLETLIFPQASDVLKERFIF